jgi:two-component system sensor histidine kinase PilS (NtrC family)
LLAFTFSSVKQDDLASCSPLLDALFAGWRQNKSLGYEVLRLPTSNRLVRVRFLPVQRQGFWGAVVVLEDIQLEQEQAQQAKLAALGRLTANMAHEVRNPLSSISHAAELLSEGGLITSQQRLLQIIIHNSERLNRIVKDVMQLNRRDRVQTELIDLAVRLPVFVSELTQSERSSTEIFNISADANCLVNFDRGHLEQVLWNLCLNALRYCQGESGSIQIKAIRAHDNRISLEVNDDGPGVDADSIQKLFEPFFTMNEQGTGLGLYIARELCEANSASLTYQTNKLGGACFRIIFGGEG